jgi:hypothetical protein
MPSLALKLTSVFRTRQVYDQALNWLQNQVEPTGPRLNSIKDSLQLQNGDIVYVDDDTGQRLVVVPPDQVENRLRLDYQELRHSVGVGQNQYWSSVRTRFANTPRDLVRRFLSRQVPYQLTHEYTKPTNRPTTSRHADSLWQGDLVEMKRLVGDNHQRKFIFNVVGVFSKKLWSRALLNKEAATLRGAFVSTVQENGGRHPTTFQSDNGKEFLREFRAHLKQNGVKVANTRTYTTLALVESVNKTVRRGLRAATVREETRRWYPLFLTLSRPGTTVDTRDRNRLRINCTTRD